MLVGRAADSWLATFLLQPISIWLIHIQDLFIQAVNLNNGLIIVCQSLSKPGNAGLLFLSAIAHKFFVLIGKSWKKVSFCASFWAVQRQ